MGKPKAPGKRIEQTAKQQATEMVAAHSNHPSIVCWGVGNELNGHSKRTVAYVREMVAFFKQLDPSRLANYVSSTLDYKKRTPMDLNTTRRSTAISACGTNIWAPGTIETIMTRACGSSAIRPKASRS